MIDAEGNFPAVADERFALQKFPTANLVVAVRKPAARQPDGKIRVRAESMDKTEFGIQIHRRERHAQGDVRAQKIRLVMVIKSVGGHRRVALERLVVAELDQVAADGVNLREAEHRDEQPQKRMPRFFSSAFW